MSLNIKLRVTAQRIEIAKICPIVSGTLGEYVLEFEFDSYWDGYAKTAVIDVICGDPIPDQLVLNNSCIFSLGNAKKIRFGVYGVKDNQRLPAVYTREILVKEGSGSVGGQDLNLTQYEQLLSIIGNIEELPTEEKSSLVAAVTELYSKGGSGGQGKDGYSIYLLNDGLEANPEPGALVKVPMSDIMVWDGRTINRGDLAISTEGRLYLITEVEEQSVNCWYANTLHGKDYVLTEADKQEIAEAVITYFDTNLAEAIGSGELV